MKRARLAYLLGVLISGFLTFTSFFNPRPAYAASSEVTIPVANRGEEPGANGAGHYASRLPFVVRDSLTANLSQEFKDFVKSVEDGDPTSARGLYMEGVLALPIVKQPAGNSAYVSDQPVSATMFQDAARQGVTGLLAHNYLSGSKFYELEAGAEVRIVFGDGDFRSYWVARIDHYQRLDFNSLRGNFKDLESGQILTSDEIFKTYYSGEHHLTLQTCLEREGNYSWGLQFVAATPVGGERMSIP